MRGAERKAGRLFYRVTRTNPPRLRDFQSNTEKGRRPPDADPETRRLWAGVSVFDSIERARERARLLPAMGRHIAAVRIPAEGRLQYEQTGADPHHFTIWGDAASLMARVEFVVPA